MFIFSKRKLEHLIFSRVFKEAGNMTINKYFLLGIVVTFCFYSVFFIFDKNTALMLGKEDSFFENLGAVCFFLTSVCFVFSFRKYKRWIFMILALMFLCATGEEISWGQRIFKIVPSKVFKESNVQGEINIHNLEVFNRTHFSGEKKTFKELLLHPDIDRLFTLFWLLWCFIIPIMDLMNVSINKKIERFHIQIPVVSFWIGSIFPVNYIISKLICSIMSKAYFGPIIETKECIYSFLFFLISIEIYKRKNDKLF